MGTYNMVRPVPSQEQLDPPYLVVDDTDGRILGELSSADEALQLLAELDPSQRISVVRVDSHDGALLHHDSLIAVRPLFPNPPATARDPAAQART
jgi:hypothetical protein